MSISFNAKQAFAELAIKHTSTPDIMATYCHDQSTVAATASPWLVAFPNHHRQVLALVQWANTYAVALLVSGGRTGLSGGAVLQKEQVVISLENMQRFIAFDPFSPSITVEAGMTITELQTLAASKNLQYPVSYASRDSAQIGGGVATNAGGIRVLKYGMTRNWVLGVKAVTGSGEELLLDNNLIKDNTGYDLKQLLIGSEGTLAIITEVTLALAAPEKPCITVLLGFNQFEALLDAYLACQHLPLIAAEFFCDKSLKKVLEQAAMHRPFNQGFNYYLLLDVNEHENTLELLAEIFAEQEVLIAQNLKQQQQFWAYREHISASLHGLKPHKNDVSCLLKHWPRLIAELAELQTQFAGTLYLFGHIGDGNMHINWVGNADQQEQFDQALMAVLQTINASISAEHGIGLLKRDKLLQNKSATEVAFYKGLKQLFDPLGILNPGKLLAVD